MKIIQNFYIYFGQFLRIARNELLNYLLLRIKKGRNLGIFHHDTDALVVWLFISPNIVAWRIRISKKWSLNEEEEQHGVHCRHASYRNKERYINLFSMNYLSFFDRNEYGHFDRKSLWKMILEIVIPSMMIILLRYYELYSFNKRYSICWI